MEIKSLVEQFYTLWTQDYWRDELFTIFVSRNSYYDIILLTAKDFNPPLFYFLTKVVSDSFKDSPFYLRQIPLFFHILSSLVSYKLARLFVSKLSSSLYALLVLTNTFLVFYSFELRPYSAMVFLAILSGYFFFSKNKVGFVISNVLGLYTHTYYLIFYLMFFVFQKLKIVQKYKIEILFVNVSTLFSDLKLIILKRYLLLPLIFYLPWVPVLIAQTISKNKGFWLEKVTIFELFSSVFTYLGGFNYIPVILTIVILVIYLAIVRLGFNKIKSKISKISLVFGFFPIVISVLVSLFTPVFTVRYLIFTVPFLLLFFVGLIDNQQKNIKAVLMSLVLILIMIYSYVDYFAFNNPTNYRYGYLAYEVLSETNIKPEQIITNSPIHYFGIKYYFEREGIKSGNVQYFNLNKTFPHFIGDVVIEEKELINRYPQQANYIYLGEKDF